MESEKSPDTNLFEQLGLEVVQGTVEVGQTYPIFGAITRFLAESQGKIVAELNYHMHITMNVPDSERLELLREHCFESGIFIARVLAKEPIIELECQTVIFGKKQGYHA